MRSKDLVSLVIVLDFVDSFFACEAEWIYARRDNRIKSSIEVESSMREFFDYSDPGPVQRELLLKDNASCLKDSTYVDQVRAKVLELELALKTFNEAHDKYHAELIDDSAIQDSIEYFESVKRMGTALIQTFDVWLKSVEFKLQEELDLAISLRPEDSISNVGSINPNASLTSIKSKSKCTSSSRSSTASSARLRASAKKATLSVEAATLKKRQDIQM